MAHTVHDSHGRLGADWHHCEIRLLISNIFKKRSQLYVALKEACATPLNGGAVYFAHHD
jgi:hypothetical protein